MAIIKPIPRADGIDERLNDEVLFSSHSILMDDGRTLQEAWDDLVRSVDKVEERMADIKDFIGNSVPIPYAKERLSYKPEFQEPEWVGYHPEFMLRSGNYNGMDCGAYSVTFVLTSKKMVWEDGENGPKTVFWYIDPNNLKVWPEQKTPYPVYSGNEYEPSWNNFDSTAIEIIKETGSDWKHSLAGTHTVYLKPRKNFAWPDGTTADKSFDWIIERAPVELPVQVGSLYFNNKEREPEWNGYGNNRNYFTITGEKTGTVAKEYTVWFKPTSNAMWRDTETDEMRSQTWNISNAALTAGVTGPDGKMKGITFEFDGNNHQPAFIGYDPAFIDARDISIAPDQSLVESTVISHRDAGEYKTKFTPNNSSTWANGSKTPIYVEWSITPMDIDIPYLQYGSTITGIKIPYDDGKAVGPDIKDMNSTWVTVSGTKGTTVKEYNTTFTLKEAGNTRWSDRTVSPVVLTWEVIPKQIAIPTLTVKAVPYNEGKTVHPTVSAYNSTYVKISGDSAANVGTDYEIKFELVDTVNTVWEDGTITPKTETWAVTAAEITAPTITNTSIVYKYNTTQGPTISSYNATQIAISGSTGKNVNTYTLTMSLLLPGVVWADTKTTADKTFSWSITRKEISVPSISNNIGKTYTGEKQYITISGNNGNEAFTLDNNYSQTSYSNDYIKISGGLSGTNATSYNVKFELQDKNNTCWGDKTTADITKTWSIAKKTLAIPVATGTYTYKEGTTHTCTFNNYLTDWMTVTGNTAEASGTHTATFVLKDKNNTQWATNVSTDQTVNWTITEATLNVASLSLPNNKKTYTYNGSAVTISATDITGFDSELYTLSGDLKKTAAGTYTAKVYIKDQNTYKWSDSSKAATDPVNITWTINKRSLTVPSVKNATTGFFYKGSAYTLNKDNDFTYGNADDKKFIDISNNSQTNAGAYNVTFAINSSHKASCYWGSNTSDTANKTASWTINKAYVGSWSIERSSVELNTDSNPNQDISVTRPGDGTVTATSSDNKILVVTVKNATSSAPKVNLADGGKSGTATATIRFSEGTNYKSSTDSNVQNSSTCKPSFTISANVTSRKTLATYTPAEIQEIVKNGLARSTFSIGDRLPINIGSLKLVGSGSYETISGTFDAVVIGFDHTLDDSILVSLGLTEHSSKIKHTMSLAIMFAHDSDTAIAFYDRKVNGITAGSTTTYLQNIYNALPTSLQNIIITTNKDPSGISHKITKYDSSKTEYAIGDGNVNYGLSSKIFNLACYEMLGNKSSNVVTNLKYHREASCDQSCQKVYEYFTTEGFGIPEHIKAHNDLEGNDICVISRSDAICNDIGLNCKSYGWNVCMSLLQTGYYYDSSSKSWKNRTENWIAVANTPASKLTNSSYGNASTAFKNKNVGPIPVGIIPCFTIG